MPVSERPRRAALALASVATAAALLLAPPSARAEASAQLATAHEAFAAAQRQALEAPDRPEAARAAFRAAAQRYRALHDEQGVVSARLFTDVANAYALAGDRGEAALWYARALVLDPTQDRAQAGLAQIQRELPWEPPPAPARELLASLFFWHAGLSFEARRALFLALWPIGCALAGLALLRGRRALAGPAAAALLAGAALGVSLGLSLADEGWRQQGVLLVSAEGRTGDGEVYGLSHTAPLPAGTVVRILEQRLQDGDAGWVHVELPDATRAWIRAGGVARVAG